MNKIWIQRLFGIIMLLISVVIVLMTRETGEDASAILFTVPLGLALLFSKKYVLNI